MGIDRLTPLPNDTAWGFTRPSAIDLHTLYIKHAWPPVRVLNELWADLPATAAEQMEGELPAGVEPHNWRDLAGPAESQLYLDELDDDRE